MLRNRFAKTFGFAALAAALAVSVASNPADAGLFGDKDKNGNVKKEKKSTTIRDGNADLKSQLGGEYKGIKHAVGVRDFENDAGFGAQFNLPQNMGVMLESGLMDTGRFVLVERDKLDVVLEEQELQARGLTAQTENVAQAQKLRPARYVATGALVEVEGNESGVGGGFSVSGVRIGGNHAKAQVTIIAKLIDTTTGEIVSKQRIIGRAGRTGLNLGLTKGKFSGDIGGFLKTPIGEAIQDSVNQACLFFAKEMQDIPADASVVTVKDGNVIINRGSAHNFMPGVILTMTEKGEDLIDPDTGEILEKAEGREIGRIRVNKVSEKVSYCTVISGEKNPARGTVAAVRDLPSDFSVEAEDAADTADSEPQAKAD